MLANFAYSRGMQIALFIVSIANAALFLLFTTNIITKINGVTPSFHKRLGFILLTGFAAYQAPVYIFYMANGMQSLSTLMLCFLSIPNPFFAILFYCVANRLLSFSIYRSIHMMRLSYIYILLIFVLNEFITSCFFKQPDNNHYNYLLDIESIGVCLIINFIIYLAISKIISHTKFLIRYTDTMPVRNLKKVILRNSVFYIAAYLCSAFLPYYVKPRALGSFYAFTILFVIFVLDTLVRYRNTIQRELDNKDLYLRTLTQAADEFAGLRHDFNNILQTYGGYLALNKIDKLKDYNSQLYATTKFAGDMLELNKKIAQNSDFAAVFLSKVNLAQQKNIKTSVHISCAIDQLYIENGVICFVTAELLDCAIAIAEHSAARRISFSIKEKRNQSKLIVITASDDSACETNQTNQTNQAQPIEYVYPLLRKHLQTYKNVSFHISVYADEFSAYIEMLPVNQAR